MKKLYLVRHAKASWENPDQSDHDRPLTTQGEADAHDIANQLKEQKVKIDAMFSSTAERALSTAQIFAEEFAFPVDKITKDSHIYTGGVEELVELIKKMDAKWNTVFLVGHDPTLTLLSHYLSEGLRISITTCGVVGIGFAMKKWDEVVETEGKFLLYLHPHHEHHEPPHAYDEP